MHPVKREARLIKIKLDKYSRKADIALRNLKNVIEGARTNKEAWSYFCLTYKVDPDSNEFDLIA